MVQPPSSPARSNPRTPTRSHRRRWHLASTAAVAALGLTVAGLVGGCAPEPDRLVENKVGVLPQNSLSRAWFVDLGLGDDPEKQIVTLDVRPQMIYAYSADKHVTAIDRKTGVVKYAMNVKSPELRLQPLVELEGFVVFPNATNLQVFDDRGVFLKSIPVPTPLRSFATGESSEATGTNRGTTIYFGASGRRKGGLVEAYDISRHDAYQKWEFITHAGGAITAAPVAYGDFVYTGDDKGEVDAVSTQRVQVWATEGGYFMTGGPIVADLRADESGLYVASRDSKLYCINRATGKLKWQYFAGAALNDAPVLTPDSVYLNTSSHGIVSLDKAPVPQANEADAPPTKAFNRNARWTDENADIFLGQDAKFAYVAERRDNPAHPEKPDRVIVALDKLTGKKAFESDHRNFTCFGVNPRDGLLYVAFHGGKIMALQPILHAGQIGEQVRANPHDEPALAMAR